MAQTPEANGTPAPSRTTATADKEPWTVEKIVSSIPGGLPASSTESPVPFFHILQRLKTTKREGWRRFGINRGESISDHMYRMSLITMFAPPSLSSRINIQHCVRMALVHDMAEALVGDITPRDGVPKDEKSRRERTTMEYFTQSLLGKVNGGLTGNDLMSIWDEYEDGKTLESQFVHDVDKIELVLQMLEYEKSFEGKVDLGEFTWVASRIQLPEVQAWAAEILRDREDFWAKNGGPHTTYTDGKKLDATKEKQVMEYYDSSSTK